jgi:hypothetical protein
MTEKKSYLIDLASQPVLQELHGRFVTALRLLEQLPDSLQKGEPSEEIIGQIDELLQESFRLQQLTDQPLPEATTLLMHQVFRAIQTAHNSAKNWLSEVASPRLDVLARAQRMKRAYLPRSSN